MYDLCIGYIVSYGFYLLVVVVPAYRERRELRSWLLRQYRELKLRLIEIYLMAIGDPWDIELPESLLDAKAFSEYFHGKTSSNKMRWHEVHNGLYEHGLSQMAMECSLFVREIQFALLKSKMENVDSIEFLNKFSRRLSRAHILKPEYDDIKGLLLFLFSLHCSWETLDGKPAVDKIGKIIEKL